MISSFKKLPFSKLRRQDSFLDGRDAVVGIDIGSSSVKVVELSYRGGNYRLESMGEAMLPSDAIIRKSISRGDIVSGVISSLVSRLGVRTKKAVIGVSGEAVALKVVNVPRMFLGKDMEKLVPDLVRTSLRRDVSGVNYSYTPLFRRNGKSEETQVLIAAVSKKTAQEYKSSLFSTGLRARVIDIDAMALSNVYTVFCRGRGQKVALVNVGASGTNLSVLDGTVPFVLRDIPLGGQWITLHLMEKFKITYEEAERIKFSIKGYARYDEIESVFADFVARATDEVKTVLDEAGEVIDRIILSGGSSRIATLADALGGVIGAPVEISNPFQNINVSDSRFDPEYIEHLAPKMAIAAGLALRGL